MLRLATTFLLIGSARAMGVITARDVVDSAVEAVEVALSPDDWAGALAATEIDLKTIGIRVKDDPTMGGLQEGDIALPSVKEFVEANNQLGRNAIRQAYRRWPNAEIPYTLSSQYGSYARSVIAKAMKEYHDKTCIRFVARDPARHPDYVYIHPDDGCYSLVGKTGGKQPLSLDSGCIQVGTIVHELMHAVGFFHEQSRSDRDQFINIVWPNVMNGADDQFEKYNLNVIDHLNEPYDYSSIMHYGPFAFSGSGKKTIEPRQAGSERMGQRVAFSATDVRKINKLYTCPSSTGGTGPAISGNGIDARQVRAPGTGPQQPTNLAPITQAPMVRYVKPAHANANGWRESPVGLSGISEIGGSTAARKCSDDNWRCPFWALLGYCAEYEEIRGRVCRMSCKQCNSGTSRFFPSDTSEGPADTDSSRNVLGWRKRRWRGELPDR